MRWGPEPGREEIPGSSTKEQNKCTSGNRTQVTPVWKELLRDATGERRQKEEGICSTLEMKGKASMHVWMSVCVCVCVCGWVLKYILCMCLHTSGCLRAAGFCVAAPTAVLTAVDQFHLHSEAQQLLRRCSLAHVAAVPVVFSYSCDGHSNCHLKLTPWLVRSAWAHPPSVCFPSLCPSSPFSFHFPATSQQMKAGWHPGHLWPALTCWHFLNVALSHTVLLSTEVHSCDRSYM